MTNQNYYTILGLNRADLVQAFDTPENREKCVIDNVFNAARFNELREESITVAVKKAFQKLAREHHPDSAKNKLLEPIEAAHKERYKDSPLPAAGKRTKEQNEENDRRGEELEMAKKAALATVQAKNKLHQAEETFKSISDANDTLEDPKKRAIYDINLQYQSRGGGGAGGNRKKSGGGNSGRTGSNQNRSSQNNPGSGSSADSGAKPYTHTSTYSTATDPFLSSNVQLGAVFGLVGGTLVCHANSNIQYKKDRNQKVDWKDWLYVGGAVALTAAGVLFAAHSMNKEGLKFSFA